MLGTVTKEPIRRPCVVTFRRSPITIYVTTRTREGGHIGFVVKGNEQIGEEGLSYPPKRDLFSRVFCGPDKQVPPRDDSEGHARRARRNRMDCQTECNGRDKRVPPSDD